MEVVVLESGKFLQVITLPFASVSVTLERFRYAGVALFCLNATVWL
jgi:hypothetical protein